MRAVALLVAACLAAPAGAQDATFTVKQMTPETALKAAQAALASCRKQGFQITVAVTDRAGVAQIVLRDRFAGPHTVETAINKAWTAVSFRQDTLTFAASTADPRNAGVRAIPRVVAVGGGVLVEAGGSILGAIGVSGGPGGEADDACAKAGVEAIRDDVNF
jgi:uncharacterized protein GlcG (DUF336 family)